MSNIPEIWKDVVGFEGLYTVSNRGNVKSLLKNIDLKLNPHKGYFRVCLYKNKVTHWLFIHRIALIAFVPNPENKTCVNHKNGIKHDNNIDNLEWATPGENMQHAFDNGLNLGRKGEKHHAAKLNEIKVLEIRELRRKKIKVVDIAKMYNISYCTAQYVIHRKLWSHI